MKKVYDKQEISNKIQKQKEGTLNGPHRKKSLYLEEREEYGERQVKEFGKGQGCRVKKPIHKVLSQTKGRECNEKYFLINCLFKRLFVGGR